MRLIVSLSADTALGLVTEKQASVIMADCSVMSS